MTPQEIINHTIRRLAKQAYDQKLIAQKRAKIKVRGRLGFLTSTL